MQLIYALFASSLLAGLASALTKYATGIHTSRAASPIISLGNHAYVKGFLSFAAMQLHVPVWIVDLLEGVFSVRPEAAFALAFVLTFDLLSGVYASWWRKTEELQRAARPSEFLSSRRLRDSTVKVAEYLAILMLFTVASNVWAVEFGWAKRWSFMMIFFTEAWSTKENFQHVPVRNVFTKLRSIYESKAEDGHLPETKVKKDDKAQRKS